MATGLNATTNLTQHKIVIVGGGPAGLAAALHIARLMPEMAAHMVILERSAHPRPKLCGGGVTVHGEGQLEQLGLTLNVPAFHIHRLRFTLGKQAFTIPCRDAMRIIQREEFDGALAQAVLDRGLALRCNERVVDIRPNPDGIEVVTATHRYQATIVIAADGAKSTVRRKLDLGHSAGIARLLRVMTPVETAIESRWQQQTAEFDFSCILSGVQGYVWHFPCYIDGQPWMNRGIFDSRVVPDQARGALKQTFFADLAAHDVDPNTVPLEGHPVRWFNRDSTFSQPHVLLTGDAAGVDPLFAEGISFALEYGSVVAEAVQHAFSTNDFSFSDYRQRLLRHPMGQLLQRRFRVARALYNYRYPMLWRILWRLADIAPAPLQRIFGAALGLLSR